MQREPATQVYHVWPGPGGQRLTQFLFPLPTQQGYGLLQTPANGQGLFQRELLGGMRRSDDKSDEVARPQLRRPGLHRHFFRSWNKIIQPFTIVLHAQMLHRRQVALHNMHLRQPVYFTIDQQPFFKVPLIQGSCRMPQRPLHPPAAQVVVQVNHPVVAFFFQFRQHFRNVFLKGKNARNMGIGR